MTSPGVHSLQRILIVEDDAMVRTLNEEWLSSEGYRVDTAPDGDAGWAAVQKHDSDLMLTDTSLPQLPWL